MGFNPPERTNKNMEDKALGLANDDTQYGAESPEVIKFRELWPDVELDAAIGSVVSIHNQIIADTADSSITEGSKKYEIVKMIKDKLLADSEEVKEDENENVESDGLESSEEKEDGEEKEQSDEEVAAAREAE